MRDMTEEEIDADQVRAGDLRAEKRYEAVANLDDDIQQKILRVPSDLDRPDVLERYDEEGELSAEDVAAFKRRLQPGFKIDTIAFVGARAGVASFHYAREGIKGLARLKAQIHLNFDGGHQELLLKELAQQEKSTRGVAGRDVFQQTWAKLSKEIEDDLPQGYFGEWRVAASSLRQNESSGLVMRAPFQGEVGEQLVKLSARDAAAYARAKGEGEEALKRLVITDENLKENAGRRAMELMQTLKTNADTAKYKDVAAMRDDYHALRQEPALQRARQVLHAAVDGGRESQPLSRIDKLLADPNAAWDALEELLTA
jgi:hypothetical protein